MKQGLIMFFVLDLFALFDLFIGETGYGNPLFIILYPPKRVPNIIQKMIPKNDAQIIPNIIQKMMANIIPKMIPTIIPKMGTKYANK